MNTLVILKENIRGSVSFLSPIFQQGISFKGEEGTGPSTPPPPSTSDKALRAKHQQHGIYSNKQIYY